MSSEASSRITSIRAADAKEVGVGNPAEETCCYPNNVNVTIWQRLVNLLAPGARADGHFLPLPAPGFA